MHRLFVQLVLALARDVEWDEEQACFRGLALALAELYSVQPPLLPEGVGTEPSLPEGAGAGQGSAVQSGQAGGESHSDGGGGAAQPQPAAAAMMGSDVALEGPSPMDVMMEDGVEAVAGSGRGREPEEPSPASEADEVLIDLDAMDVVAEEEVVAAEEVAVEAEPQDLDPGVSGTAAEQSAPDGPADASGRRGSGRREELHGREWTIKHVRRGVKGRGGLRVHVDPKKMQSQLVLLTSLLISSIRVHWRRCCCLP